MAASLRRPCLLISRLLLKPALLEQRVAFSLDHFMRSERLLSRWNSGCNNSFVSSYIYTPSGLRQPKSTSSPNPPSSSLGQLDPSAKMWLSFVCKPCGHRNSRLISRQAYTKGVVIVKCENCGRNHLIADNLDWWPDLKGMKNVEDFLRAKGEEVNREGFFEGLQEEQDTIEVVPKQNV